MLTHPFAIRRTLCIAIGCAFTIGSCAPPPSGGIRMTTRLAETDSDRALVTDLRPPGEKKRPNYPDRRQQRNGEFPFRHTHRD